MTQIKKGSKFKNNSDDVVIIEREGHLILSKITMGYPGSETEFFDIGQVAIDSSGVEHFQPSMNNNGLTDNNNVKTPKPEAEMRIRFYQKVEELELSRRSKAETLATYNTRADNRVKRVSVVKDLRDQARSELAGLVNGDSPLNDVLINKRAAALTAEISKCEQILNVIR